MPRYVGRKVIRGSFTIRGQLTVDDLKAFCKAKNLSVKGKKADLVERVSEWLGEHK